MTENANLKTKPVAFLHPADEMRYPYERILKTIGMDVTWFDSSLALAQSEIADPLAIVIDIDILPKPLEQSLATIRMAYPNADLIAISGSDSSQVALICIRSGCSDFLLKPTSPEELLWSLKKSQQRNELFQKMEEPGTNLVRALTQVSGCSTPALVHLCSLQFLQHFFKSEGCAWLSMKGDAPKVLCSIPRETKKDAILKHLPSLELWDPLPPGVTWSKKSGQRKVFISCQNGTEGVLLWGIEKKVSGEKLVKARTLLEHSELSLLNLQKFDEIKQQTFLDELTGLYNSRYLRFAIGNAILKCKKPTDRFAVLFIDVDHFKAINTKHGHIIGSHFLVAIGKTVRNNVRNIDPVFRYGGDEFVVILSDTNEDGAKEIAERIRKNIERRLFSIQGLKLNATVSVGIAVYPEHAADQETILKLADAAMYSAKESSRNAVHTYSPADPSEIQAKKLTA